MNFFISHSCVLTCICGILTCIAFICIAFVSKYSTYQHILSNYWCNIFKCNTSWRNTSWRNVSSQYNISQYSTPQYSIPQYISRCSILSNNISHYDLYKISYSKVTQYNISQCSTSQCNNTYLDISKNIVPLYSAFQYNISPYNIFFDNISWNGISRDNISRSDVSRDDVSRDDVSRDDVSRDDVSRDDVSRGNTFWNNIKRFRCKCLRHKCLRHECFKHRCFVNKNIVSKNSVSKYSVLRYYVLRYFTFRYKEVFQQVRLIITSIFIIAALTLCQYSKSLTSFVIFFEIYSLLYILFLYYTSNTLEPIKRLLILTMFMDSIMAYGLSLKNEIGYLLILMNILFKLGAAPFCSWILDLYPKISTQAVLFSDAIVKLLLVNNILVFLRPSVYLYNICGILSIIYSTFRAFRCNVFKYDVSRYNDIKQFLGIINIGHIGVILLLLANCTDCRFAVIIYTATYSICSYLILFLENFNFKSFNFKNFSNKSYVIYNMYNNKIECFKNININNTCVNNTYINNIGAFMNRKSFGNNIMHNVCKITNIILLLSIPGLPPFPTFFAKICVFQCLSLWVIYIILIYFIFEMLFILNWCIKNYKIY